MHSPPQPPLSSTLAKHVLVADDDASTRQFFAGALGTLGYQASLANDGAEAIALAKGNRYDAVILDCRMPAAGASAVLAALKADHSALSRAAVFLATSAEMSADLREALLNEGFAAALEKPCRVASLAWTLATMLGPQDNLPLLDREKGLAATGDEATLRALCELFREELRELRESLNALADQPDELVERLHRLRSACGFCGTVRLAAQARALQSHLGEAGVMTAAALAVFAEELAHTLAALDEAAVSEARATP